MRRALVTTLGVLGLLVWACPAAGQSLDQTFFIGTGEITGANSIDLPVAVSGSIAVDFHGSQAAGCAALGRCGLSGSEVLDPGKRGDLVLAVERIRGKRKLFGLLALGERGSVSTVAHTERASAAGPPGMCGDLNAPISGISLLNARPASSLSVRVGGSSVALLGDDLFVTRCPGPLESDLLPLLPSRRLPQSVIRHGGSMDLSTTRPFTAAGFAGTLRSTVVLRFGHRRRNSPSSGTIRPSRASKHRLRVIEVVYRIEQVTGSVGLAFSGLGDPAQCLELDACGATGTVDESPAATAGSFVFSSITPASRDRRGVRTLLGLARDGDTSHVGADGYGEWHSRMGRVQASLSWTDGGAPCVDRLPMRSGYLAGSVERSRFTLQYAPTGTDDSLHTHCGGPFQGDLTGSGGALASGSLPFTALRHRTVTMHLTRPPAVVPTTGYSGSVTSQITVTLRREKVREQTFSVPF